MFESPPRRTIDINLIPLINVVFLLLIFFLEVGTFTTPLEHDTTPPRAETGTTRYEPAIVLVIHQDALLLNDQPIEMEQLTKVVKAELANPDEEILVKAHAALPSHKLREVFRLIAAAGGSNLTLATEVPHND